MQLKTVFVELIAPPTSIQLEGLPLNVVPIYKMQTKVKCMMSNGKVLSISRDQVPLVPNFAMTGYSSQGRTQINNVVNLSNCKNHQSIYTCLSRGSTYEGIAINQRFDDFKIRGSISGWLRQEFRELELLNEITRLQYLRKLPINVDGVTRKQMIHRYRELKGEDFVPQSIPIAIQ